MDMRRDPNILVMLLARQYRAERNFWLSVFTISSWSALWVIYQVGGCVFLGGVEILGVWCAAAKDSLLPSLCLEPIKKLLRRSCWQLNARLTQSHALQHHHALSSDPAQVNREKHVLRGKLLALQGKGGAAADEISFLGAKKEDEMRQAAKDVAAATKPPGPVPAEVELVAKKDL